MKPFDAYFHRTHRPRDSDDRHQNQRPADRFEHRLLYDPRPWAALVFAGLLISMIDAVSISRMFPPRMAKMPGNEPEFVGITRENWFSLRKWTVSIVLSGSVSSIALLVLLRTLKARDI